MLYAPDAGNSTVIYVGVPPPFGNGSSTSNGVTNGRPSAESKSSSDGGHVFTFLCLGIVCPRKNQVWAVELFRAFAGDRTDVRLLIVGARYTRDYEVQYVDDVKRAAADDPRIEILDVTEVVEVYYEAADALLVTSVNEVTPMVICEAMAFGLPVLR
jgi:glycosyltransferase involved in cell wall biosynthesis